MSSRHAIPSIEQLRQREAMGSLESEYGHAALVTALRVEVSALRERLSLGDTSEDVVGTIELAVRARLKAMVEPSLRAVINATGVVVHTNLGRAPLCEAAVARVASLAAGYTNLEYDVTAGCRGRREIHAERLLCHLTGAQAAVIVNNNAAAALISLTALAAGREVVISRGELVEIGGGFRVPDVLAQSGAMLREVGTTNRTRVDDYAAAISERTALILRVHPSNFRIEGFTERPSLHSLVALGQRFSIPVADDIGSGYLNEPLPAGILRDEPSVIGSVRAGVDLVMFSGDKLLGGPQAGVLVGNEDCVRHVRRHPLMRALRVGKMTYAALEATLGEYACGRADDTVPVARMIALSIDAIGKRADVVQVALSRAGLDVEVTGGYSTVGGGSAPGTALPTRLVRLHHASLSADELQTALRRQPVPVISRIEDGRVILDLRTVQPGQDEQLIHMVSAAIQCPSSLTA